MARLVQVVALYADFRLRDQWCVSMLIHTIFLITAVCGGLCLSSYAVVPAGIVLAAKAWNWGLVANTIARALGPAFLKGAGKYLGGPAMIAATLAGGAAVCAWQSRWGA